MEGSFFFKLMIAARKGGRQEDQSPLWHFLLEQSKKFRGREKNKFRGRKNISLGGEKKRAKKARSLGGTLTKIQEETRKA